MPEPPVIDPATADRSEFGHRMSCCWYGDKRIVHAVRNVGIQNLQSACGKWVWDLRIRRDTKPVTCPACTAVLEGLTDRRREAFEARPVTHSQENS